MRPDLPRGTVTFLFTDIEGSTRLLAELGEQSYAGALAEHRGALRAAFAAHGGVEVDTQGDAFFYAFPSAPEAATAAVEGQQALAGGPIRVRMGLHTGTPTVTDGGYVGTDVHRAARIAAVGHGGQVLLSAATAELARRDDLADLGKHRLKDLSAPERIHQVGDAAFPPLRSLYRTNLPVPATPLLGRETELAELRALVARPDVRLLTLTGAGGTGKTRLALHLAGLVSEGYPDGVYWVPLAGTSDPDLVPTLAAVALGASEDLSAAIGAKRMLLVLDNFEHLLPAATQVAGWLTACPSLDIVVTSREALRISSEQRYAVPPLSDAGGPELFVARARAVDPGFADEPAVHEICHRLDNLPLAIELAAARVNVLTSRQLLARLTERLPMLETAARDAPERHRTLRATIAWSYDLLSGEEQRLFRQLAVFTGGCTLETAESVVAANVDDVAALVDKSLLRHTVDRFWMLETIREFALERLAGAGEAGDASRRHAEHFAALARSANLSVEHFDEGQHHEIVLPEIVNLRAAMDWATRARDVGLALSIAVALEQFWSVTSPREGIRRLTGLLEAEDGSVDAHLRARALRALGAAYYVSGDFDTGTTFYRQALAAFHEAGDEQGVGHLMLRLGFESARVGDVERARRMLADSEQLTRMRVDLPQRLALLARLAHLEGRDEESLELTLQSARSAAEMNFTWWQAGQLLGYCELAIQIGQHALANEPCLEAVRLALQISDRQGLAYGLTTLAVIAARAGEDEAAGRWFGAVEAESEREPFGQWEKDRDETSRLMPANPHFERGRRAGRALNLWEAAALAVS